MCQHVSFHGCVHCVDHCGVNPSASARFILLIFWYSVNLDRRHLLSFPLELLYVHTNVETGEVEMGSSGGKRLPWLA